MTLEEMKDRVSVLEAEIAGLLTEKEALAAQAEPIRARLVSLRAELGPLTTAITKLGDLDEATLDLIQGVTRG